MGKLIALHFNDTRLGLTGFGSLDIVVTPPIHVDSTHQLRWIATLSHFDDGWTAYTCTAGETESRDCGRCGTQTRRGGGACTWGAWSACPAEECEPGETRQEGCCDCGTRSRACGSDCTWGGWGACGGPDPAGGTEECDTGLPGACADGRVRCVAGCRTCVPLVDPTGESCGAPEETGPEELREGVESIDAAESGDRIPDGARPDAAGEDGSGQETGPGALTGSCGCAVVT